MELLIKKNYKVLFIGDSITDAGRDRKENSNDLGKGYVYLIAGQFQAKYPKLNVKFINRGINGDRVDTIYNRWDNDCINLKPDIVTILIGINNTIHRFKRDLITTTDEFEKSYRDILEKTVNETNAQIILMEQFLLPVEKKEDTPVYVPVYENINQCREDINPKIDVVKKLAREYNTMLISLDGMFASASTKAPSEYWLPDGIHPSPAGAGLIAQAWLKAVNAID